MMQNKGATPSPFKWFVRLMLQLAALLPFIALQGARAQPASSAIHGVTVFDVAPAAAAQGVALAKKYRDGTLGQSGNTGVTILQEIGRPHWIAIHEGWVDQSAYDASEQTAGLTALREGLKSIGRPPFDRRGYGVISVGPAQKASTGGTIYMHLHLDVFPRGVEPTVAALKGVADAARKGEGNLQYDVFKSVKSPMSHFTILAAWRSREAFEDYESSVYARQFRDIVGPLLGSPYDDRLKITID